MTTHPLTASLDRGRARSHRGCDFGALLMPAPPDGAVRLERLVADGARLDALLDGIGNDVGSRRRDVQASLFLEAYAWTLLLPLAGALLSERRVPGLAGARVTLRNGLWPDVLVLSEPRFATLDRDPDADHPAAVVVADEHGLTGRLRAELLSHLGAPVAALAARSHRPERALWRSVGDRASAALLFAGEAGGDVPRAAALATQLLDGPGPLVGRPEYRKLAAPDGPMRVHVRSGCCLWWRTRASSCCVTCPLAAGDEGRDTANPM